MLDTVERTDEDKYAALNHMQKFHDWHEIAKPCDRFEYHRGAGLFSSILSFKMRDYIWTMALEGKIYLVQKRHGNDDYSYIAIKASNPPKESLIPNDGPVYTNSKEHMRKAVTHQVKALYTHKKRLLERAM